MSHDAPSPGVTLRPATAADSDFAYAVKQAAFRAYVEAAGGWDEAEQHALHQQRFATQTFRIIMVEGQDVGVLALAEASNCLRLHQLFLLPAAQGRGIGSEVMQGVMAQARQQGVPIRLRVLQANPRARRFYERLGFRCTGATESHDLLEWQP